MPNQQINKSPNHPLPLFTAAALAALIATAGGHTLGWDGLWMFALLVHIPLWLRLLLAAPILLAAIIPPINQSTNQPPLHPLILPFAALIFWFFRERTLHGDGPGKLFLHTTATLQTDPYVWKEPLDSLLAYMLSGFFKNWGLPPENAIALWSVLAGVLFLVAAGKIAGLLGRDRGEEWRYFLALIASGSALLWFGHIENYSLVTAVSVASTALALAHLRGQVPLWSVGLVAGAAAALHPQAAFAFGGLLVLMDWSALGRGKWQIWLRQGVELGISGAIVPVLTVVIMFALGVPLPGSGGGGGAAGIPGGETQLFWMPWEALAPARLWDALVNLWLVAPLLPLLIVGIVMALRAPRLRRDPIFAYLTLAGLGMLAYHFSFQNELARPRDWDLFAIVGPYITLWGVWGMHNAQWPMHNGAATPQSPIPNPQSRLFLTFALVFTIAWVGVNHAVAFVDPDPAHPVWFQRVRVADLAELVPAQEVRQISGADGGEAETAIFVADGDKVSLGLALPDEPLFLWVQPQAVGDGDVRFELRLIPAQGDPLAWQGRAGEDVRLPLDAVQGQTVAIILWAEGGDGLWVTPWILAGTPHSWAR